MISAIRTYLMSIPRWVFWLLLSAMALIILIFNDRFGDSEIFGILAFLYFLLLIFLICRWIFKQIKAIINLKKEKATTELMHLKSQVNPHFFFNMLNNLYGIVEQDAPKAQQLILKLSDLMRYGIYEGQNDTVLMTKEVDYLENYIALHQMRYHKQIDIQFDKEIKDDVEIMPLLFIILLENAFKHGVENLREDAYIHIKIEAEKGRVFFEIENNFDPVQESLPHGIGLQNLKRRLALVYPKKHILKIDKTTSIFRAQLTINGL